MYRRAVSSAPSIAGVHTQKSASNGGCAALPCSSRTSSRCFWIAGMRIGHGRSANITMCAFSRAAETTESSDEATAYTRPSKLRAGRGRISTRGCR
jgi:hypothetical protein